MIGQNKDDAKVTLENAGFVVTLKEEESDEDKDTVDPHRPVPGRHGRRGHHDHRLLLRRAARRCRTSSGCSSSRRRRRSATPASSRGCSPGRHHGAGGHGDRPEPARRARPRREGSTVTIVRSRAYVKPTEDAEPDRDPDRRPDRDTDRSRRRDARPRTASGSAGAAARAVGVVEVEQAVVRRRGDARSRGRGPSRRRSSGSCGVLAVGLEVGVVLDRGEQLALVTDRLDHVGLGVGHALELDRVALAADAGGASRPAVRRWSPRSRRPSRGR